MDKLLEIMPKMLMGRELDDAMQVLPPYDPAIRSNNAAARIIALQDLYGIYLPSQMSREIYSKLYLGLLRSLQKKQSMLAVRQAYANNRMMKQEFFESIIGGSDCFSIVGQSGIGKSSTVSRAVSLLMERPIILNQTKIIPFLTIQAPADSSMKGLMFEILRKADEILGTNYHVNAQRARATTDTLIGSIAQIAMNHIGVLIVDEIQNVVSSKNGRTVVGVLTQLINNSGISICLVGTPECTVFFEQARILARRTLGLRYDPFPYGADFKTFCRCLLRYCYTKAAPEVDEAMLMWIYNHSGGNASVVVSLIHDAQEIAVLDGTERLDLKSLTAAYGRRLTMLRDYISPEQTKRPRQKKASILPAVREMQDKTDDKNVYQILMTAKESKASPVTELIIAGIIVEEVAI